MTAAQLNQDEACMCTELGQSGSPPDHSSQDRPSQRCRAAGCDDNDERKEEDHSLAVLPGSRLQEERVGNGGIVLAVMQER